MPESPTAYLDKAGRPRLRQSIVAFIDILGFSQSSTSCTSMEDAQRLLDKIAAAIDDSRSFVREPIPDGESAARKPLGDQVFQRQPRIWLSIR